MNEETGRKPTGVTMMDFLCTRLGSHDAMLRAISDFRASVGYKGKGATIMDAVQVLYDREIEKVRREPE